MSLASVASSTQSSSTSSGAALNSLSSNFNSFLQLLMTQLQNQDPSSPVSTDQFTQELVEFSGVQQQVNTNTSLGSLIQLTQGDSVVQGSSLIGKQVTVSSSDISLANSSGTIGFTATNAEPATVTISDASGNVIDTSTVNATAGANSFTWNGVNSGGATEPDGTYTVKVTDSGGNALSSSVTGTASGISSNGSSVYIEVDGQSLPLSSVLSVASASS